MPRRQTIDPNALRAAASEPDATMMTVAQSLGVGYSTLAKKLQTDAQLNRIYAEAHGSAPLLKTEKRSGKKAATANTPPRNGRSKGGMTDELRKRIVAEFAFIEAWGEVSEHFEELRAEVAALA